MNAYKIGSFIASLVLVAEAIWRRKQFPEAVEGWTDKTLKITFRAKASEGYQPTEGCGAPKNTPNQGSSGRK
jgi:hypothetical protein